MTRRKGQWLLWSTVEGTVELRPKRPPKASASRRLEVSADGRWLEIHEGHRVTEVYVWSDDVIPRAGTAAGTAARRTRG